MKRARAHRKLELVVMIVAVVTAAALILTVSLFSTKKASATLAGWNAGNIMSDAVMSNKNAMTEAQIQSFLTSKNPCTNNDYDYYTSRTASGYQYIWIGPKNSTGHFGCISNEVFGADGIPTTGSGQTAAHIIYTAAQRYSINPQVFLVLLQKEQGLITDTSPNSIQWRSATGYGCPDTAACDSKYYGFINQINQAGAFFQQILSGQWSGNYPIGTRSVLYSPNSSCGSSMVNIQNRATAALYTYTPYQPDQAALKAGYGTGDSCSSYGNRNFYNYFTDWFGSTQIVRYDVQWESMVKPRIMTVNTPTLKVNPYTDTTDTNWLEPGEQLIFTQKTSTYHNGAPFTCLRTKDDVANKVDLCVLMPRMSEYTPEYIAVDPAQTNMGTVEATCRVNLDIIHSVCNEGTFSVDQAVQVAATTEIMGVEYYITQKDWDAGILNRGMLAERLRLVYPSYRPIDPVAMIAMSDTHKYVPGDDVSQQDIQAGQVILFSQVTETLDHKEYYRTTYDLNYGNDYAIPAEALSNKVFIDFKIPRTMVAIRNTKSSDITTGKLCGSVAKGKQLDMVTKTSVDDKYFRTKAMTEQNTFCAIPSVDMGEIAN